MLGTTTLDVPALEHLQRFECGIVRGGDGGDDEESQDAEELHDVGLYDCGLLMAACNEAFDLCRR